MISAVFDSTTLLQAATNRKGPAGACLAFVDEGRVRLFKAFPKLTDESVHEFLEHLVDKGHTVADVPPAFRFDRDPDDEPFLNLAIATQAAFIVSRDNDLLDLMKDEEFRRAYPALAVLDPVAFLHHIRAEIAKECGNER